MVDSDQQQPNDQKKKSKRQSAKKQKGKPKKKEPKKKKEKDEQKQQKKQQKKQKGKKKGSKSKPKKGQKKQELSEQNSKQLVLQYMTKQNRPYSLINIFDNLHGIVKKAPLEKILEQLCDQKQLAYKQFGKNKIFMLQQSKFNISKQELEQLTSEYCNLKQESQQLEEEVKQLNQSLKNINAKPKIQDLLTQIKLIKQQIIKFQKKMVIYGGDWKGVDPVEVQQIQQKYNKFLKQSKKRQKIVREGIKQWSQVLEKKFAETAQILGIDLE